MKSHSHYSSPNQEMTHLIDLPSLSVVVNILFVINILITLLMLYYTNTISQQLDQSLTEVVDDGWLEGLMALGEGLNHAHYLLLIMMALTGVLGLVWLHQATKNVIKLGSDQLQTTPIKAVSTFFIPIVNIWRVRPIFQELMSASFSPHHPHNRYEERIIYCWWLLFFSAILIFHLYLYHLLEWDYHQLSILSAWHQYDGIALYSNLFGIAHILLSSVSIYLVHAIDNDQYMHAEAYHQRAVVA